MYDNDQMTDSSELQELHDAVSSVGMPGRPPLEAIKSRGRAQRRQRRTRATRFSVGGVVIAGALAVGVSLAASPAQNLGTIQRAAYTLRHNQNGTDTLSLNPVELLNPSQLQSDLAQYGISAKVTTGSYCTTTPEPPGSHRPSHCLGHAVRRGSDRVTSRRSRLTRRRYPPAPNSASAPSSSPRAQLPASSRPTCP